MFYKCLGGEKLIMFLLTYPMLKFRFEKSEIIFSGMFLFKLHQKGEMHP